MRQKPRKLTDACIQDVIMRAIYAVAKQEFERLAAKRSPIEIT